MDNSQLACSVRELLGQCPELGNYLTGYLCGIDTFSEAALAAMEDLVWRAQEAEIELDHLDAQDEGEDEDFEEDLEPVAEAVLEIQTQVLDVYSRLRAGEKLDDAFDVHFRGILQGERQRVSKFAPIRERMRKATKRVAAATAMLGVVQDEMRAMEREVAAERRRELRAGGVTPALK